MKVLLLVATATLLLASCGAKVTPVDTNSGATATGTEVKVEVATGMVETTTTTGAEVKVEVATGMVETTTTTSTVEASGATATGTAM